MNEYFKHEDDRCIGCYICLNNDNKKMISYKYPKDIKSDYNIHYLRYGADKNAKAEAFNYD